MYNGNGIVAGGGATAVLLPLTGSGHLWLAGAAGGLIVLGFALAHHAGRRRAAQTVSP